MTEEFYELWHDFMLGCSTKELTDIIFDYFDKDFIIEIIDNELSDYSKMQILGII